MTVRYFLAASDSAYQSLRQCLDAANGYPSSDGVTITTLPDEPSHRASDGRPLFAGCDVIFALARPECFAGVQELTASEFSHLLPESQWREP